jgi:hypothetical protein
MDVTAPKITALGFLNPNCGKTPKYRVFDKDPTNTLWTKPDRVCILGISKIYTPQASMGSKAYKVHLKETYRDIPPRPFAPFDYLLCILVYVLLGIAWIPALAEWFVRR